MQVHSHDVMMNELRALILHEMVVRILKTTFYKILREANGLRYEKLLVYEVLSYWRMRGSLRQRSTRFSERLTVSGMRP